MEELIKEMIDKGLVSIVKKAIEQQEISNYTSPYTKPDTYTDWIRLYQRN